MKKLYTLLAFTFFASTLFAVNVTFKVNMSNETVSANGVHVAGNFDANGSTGTAWSPSAYPMTDNGSGTYEATIDLEPGMYEFKFINDNDWPGAENVPAGAQVGGGNSNRWVMVTGAMDVPTVCFAGVVDCGKVGVTFQVNMATQTVSAAGVHIAGSLQGWDPAGTMMYNPDGGTVYKYIHAFNSGDSVQFKFVNGDAWGDDEQLGGLPCENGGNRYMNGLTADTTMLAVCYGSCDECQTVDWTLRVDMTNETVSPNGVHVAGSMQGWDPAGTELTDPDGDGIYEVVLAVQPQSFQYKFVNGNAWGSEEGVPTSCNSGGNRDITLSAGVDTTTTFCFGSCTWPCAAFPDSAEITFSVDMDTTMVSSDVDSGGVWIMGTFTSPKWQDGAIKLTDNGDGTYSTMLTIGGAPDMEYKFVNGKPNTSLSEEESGDFLTLGCGVENPVSTPNRYYNRTDVDTTLSFCWNMCTDCGQSSISEIKNQLDDLVSVYPNPFTAATNVTFEKEGNYLVSVFDVTGKLVFEARNNGSKQMTVNLTDSQKGIYLMKVTNELGEQTTKMLLVQ